VNMVCVAIVDAQESVKNDKEYFTTFES
jgi:hypothetical protein